MVNIRERDLLSEKDSKFATQKLAEFGDSWKRPDDFEEKVVVINVVRKNEQHEIKSEQYLTESHEELVCPPEQYKTETTGRSSRMTAYERAQDTWLNELIEFADPEPEVSECDNCAGNKRVDCTKCSDGTVDCTRCRGTGRQSCSCGGFRVPKGRRICSTCSKGGTVTRDGEKKTCPDCTGKGHLLCRDCNGAGGYRCTRCNGSEEIECPECKGELTVICGHCNGGGKVAHGLIGTLEFETIKQTSTEPTFDVPEQYIERVEGALENQERDWLGADGTENRQVIRRKQEFRTVPVRKITYEYDNIEWNLFDIGGIPWVEAYPESSSRRFLPYILSIIIVVSIGLGMYLLF